MSIGDALRKTARLMVEAGEIRTPTYMVILKVANRMDEQADVPAHVIPIDVLADACRSTNVARNGHPMEPWAEIVDDPQQEHIVEIWRKRAIVMQEEINAATDRSQK